MIKIVVGPELGTLIQTLLQPDLRDSGSRGRALVCDVATLKKGDRLEVGGSITDVHQDVSTVSFPASLWLWRQRSDSMLNAPRPLLTSGALTLESIVGGWLRNLDEGVCQYLGGPHSYNALRK